MTRTELIAALEKAEGPDRTWDTLIWECVGLSEREEYHCKIWCSQDGRKDISRGMFLDAWAPEFSSSIDAAWTLVPDGTIWKLFSDWPGDAYFAVVEGDTWLPEKAKDEWRSGRQGTPAIALCIAALKARGETP